MCDFSDFADGMLDLQYILRSDASTSKHVFYDCKRKVFTLCSLLRLFMDSESGDHVYFPFFRQDKIKAFKLEPAEGVGIIALDGEVRYILLAF